MNFVFLPERKAYLLSNLLILTSDVLRCTLSCSIHTIAADIMVDRNHAKP